MKKLFYKLISIISIFCISGCSLNISIGKNDTQKNQTDMEAPVIVEVPEENEESAEKHPQSMSSKSTPTNDTVQNTNPQKNEEWQYETAVVNGCAAVLEYRDHIRKNIHLNNIEEYVKGTIRPIYYAITDKFDKLESVEGNSGITWYFGDSELSKGASIPIACVKYDAGTNGNKYERRYYFDSLNDELIFAFIFLGKEEYRLYFYKDSIIRYIDDNGRVFDNPEEQYILDKGQDAISEAYVYWD